MTSLNRHSVRRMGNRNCRKRVCFGCSVFFPSRFVAGDMEKKKFGENLTPRLSNAERFHCTAPSENMDQYPELMDVLPKDYQYHVCSYRAVNANSDHTDFEATIRMSLKSKEEILVWLKSMPVTWRVDYTRPTKGSKIIFRTDYRCQHNTRPRTTSKNGRASKNTDCPGKLKISLARTTVFLGRQSRSTDPHIPDYPTLVDIVNVHNHSIHAADALRHRDVGSKAVEQLTKLFEAGHSPSSALNVLKYDLQVQFGNDYANASADRSICPELQFCYRLYYKIFRKEYSSAGEDDHIHDGLQKPLQDQENLIKVSGGPAHTPEFNNQSPETSMETVEELEADKTLEAAVSAQEWDSMNQEFAAMVQSSREFQVAGSAFIKAFKRLKGNPSMLQAAMHMFGRHGASSQARRRTANCAGPSTATQPTGRKVKLGGRRQLASRKHVAAVDHRYSNPKGVGSPSKTQSLSSCSGASQQPKIIDTTPPSPPLHNSWTLDHCPPYSLPSSTPCPSTHNSSGAIFK